MKFSSSRDPRNAPWIGPDKAALLFVRLWLAEGSGLSGFQQDFKGMEDCPRPGVREASSACQLLTRPAQVGFELSSSMTHNHGSVQTRQSQVGPGRQRQFGDRPQCWKAAGSDIPMGTPAKVQADTAPSLVWGACHW